MEHRDVVNKFESGKLAMPQQRMKRNVAGVGSSSGAIGSRVVENSQVQESERSTVVECNVSAGNDQPLQQIS